MGLQLLGRAGPPGAPARTVRAFGASTVFGLVGALLGLVLLRFVRLRV